MVWRVWSRDGRRVAFLWGAAAVGAVLLRPVWDVAATVLPICLFRWSTGVACPTCGTTRAALALLHGDLPSALGANPLAAAIGGAFLAGGVVAPGWAALRWPVPSPDPRPRERRLALAGGALLLANWIYLIAAGV